MTAQRCPQCNHVPAIHDRDGSCPRWAGVSAAAQSGTRVCFRVGTRRWPECDGHMLAYFVDSLDPKTGVCLVWDLTGDTQFHAPAVTGSTKTNWTVRPGLGQVRDAIESLQLEIGDKVRVMRNVTG